MLWTPNRAANACSASVSTLPNRKCGSTFAAAAAKPGAIWRHGPHHSAQKSIRSGMSLDVACFSKFVAFSSTGCPSNSELLHFPQRPPSASFAAGTRLSVAHAGHAITSRSPSIICQSFLFEFAAKFLRNPMTMRAANGQRCWIERYDPKASPNTFAALAAIDLTEALARRS